MLKSLRNNLRVLQASGVPPKDSHWKFHWFHLDHVRCYIAFKRILKHAYM